MKAGGRGLVIVAAAGAVALAAVAGARAGGDRIAWFAEARATFEAQCNVCHPLERALSKTFDRPTWVATVERMHDNGAEVDSEQRRQVVDYLFTKNLFERKCSLCHGTDRPLGRSKSGAEWLATVKRMADRKPGHLTEAEVDDIAAYLAAVRPAR